MIFRFPTINDKEILEDYVQEHYENYGVRPTERKKGYTTQMLKYALEFCKEKNLKSIIVGCYKDNIASSKTIIKNKNGGILINEIADN